MICVSSQQQLPPSSVIGSTSVDRSPSAPPTLPATASYVAPSTYDAPASAAASAAAAGSRSIRSRSVPTIQTPLPKEKAPKASDSFLRALLRTVLSIARLDSAAADSVSTPTPPQPVDAVASDRAPSADASAMNYQRTSAASDSAPKPPLFAGQTSIADNTDMIDSSSLHAPSTPTAVVGIAGPLPDNYNNRGILQPVYAAADRKQVPWNRGSFNPGFTSAGNANTGGGVAVISGSRSKAGVDSRSDPQRQ